MTTITSHSLPLLPLRSNLGNLFGKRINDEPICPSSSLIRLGSSPKEDDDRQQQLSPQDCYGSENSQSNTICDIIDRRSMNGMDSRFAIGALTNDEAAISEPRSVNSASSYKADGGVHNNKDDDDEEMSYCSDDSELSVGKEVDDSVPASKSKALNFNDSKKTSIPFRIDDDSSTHERNERLAAALRYQPKLPNIIRPNPTRQEEFLRKSHFYAEEIMKHQINFMSVTKGLNISPKLSDNTFNYPVRPNALAPIHSAAISNPVKIELSRLQAFANDSDLSKKWSVIEDRSSCSPEATSFREIHSHLNAISKITSALGRDTCSRVQMTSPDSIASRESSQSPPTPHVQPFHHMLHNNFNESNLKFSIDNILKPSFGRRITDPLLKRNKAPRKNASQQRAAQLTASSGDGIAGRTPSIDSTAITAGNKTPALSPSDQTVTKLSMPSPNSASATGEQMDKTNSSTTSAKSNNNNGSMAWPAWVYCTRYSDRPSSGNLHSYFYYLLFLVNFG